LESAPLAIQAISSQTQFPSNPFNPFASERDVESKPGLWLLFLTGFCLATPGCGGAGYPVSDVEGTVQVDKAPVNEGTVTFTPTVSGIAISAEIRGGKYLAKGVAQGKNLVHLYAFKETGGTVVELGIKYPEKKNVIPDKYMMGIEVQVSESKMTHNFDLTAK
jgi:hypothetical protein